MRGANDFISAAKVIGRTVLIATPRYLFRVVSDEAESSPRALYLLTKI